MKKVLEDEKKGDEEGKMKEGDEKEKTDTNKEKKKV